jgi:predicted P-loop ATPase
LRDPTGNRRIWPVQCRSVGAADIQWLADNREQLWAEAAHQEATGTSIWLDDLGVQQTAVEAQGALMADDPWADRVRRYIQDRASVTIPEILEEALLIALSVQDRRAQMRVATILQVAGWTKKQVWNAEMQTSVKQWTPPARQEAEGG